MSDAVAAVFDRTIIDYLRVTSDEEGYLRDVLRGPIERLKHGLGVYQVVERDGYGSVYCSGGPDGGQFMLQMSGEPLSSWRAERKERDLVAHIASRRSRCARIDLARDTTGDCTPYWLRDMLDADRYVTTWRNPPVYTQTQRGPLTVRLGSRMSDFMLRVYDKRGEMLANEKECPHERLSRWEAEIKDELAASAFNALWMRISVVNQDTNEETITEPTAVDRLHASWLAKRLRLTTEPVRRESKEQTRAETDPMWAAFVAASDGSELVPEADERTPAQQAEDFARWFVKCHAGSLATFEQLAGRDALELVLTMGAIRRSAKQRMFVERMSETRPAVRAVVELDRDSPGAASPS